MEIAPSQGAATTFIILTRRHARLTQLTGRSPREKKEDGEGEGEGEAAAAYGDSDFF